MYQNKSMKEERHGGRCRSPVSRSHITHVLQFINVLQMPEELELFCYVSCSGSQPGQGVIYAHCTHSPCEEVMQSRMKFELGFCCPFVRFFPNYPKLKDLLRLRQYFCANVSLR